MIKNKKNYFLYFGILLVMTILLTFVVRDTGKITLQSGEEKTIKISGNSSSLDSKIIFNISSNGQHNKLKLSYGGDWYEIKEDLHFNIADTQIEKWTFDDSGKLITTILPDGSTNISVDSDGVIIETPFELSFAFASKSDFVIKVRNESDSPTTFNFDLVYE